MADDPVREDEQAPESAPEHDEPSRVRVPRRPESELRRTEMVRGQKVGSRYARRKRAGDTTFEISDEGEYVATARATAPLTGVERWLRAIRRGVFGSPISSEHLEDQRLPKTKALAVFSSDALSSSAYATDEILLVLVTAGTGALTHSVYIALAVGALLAVVTFSYRQTIRAYPGGGGAYIVARDNLGDFAGLTAAAGLSVGYIMTVAVSIAAGVFAVVSAFPELHDYSVPIGVVAVLIITLLNLRGIRESGTIFAIPTYGFIVAFVLLIGWGFVRLLMNPDLQAEEPEAGWVVAGSAGPLWFIILRAFSSGSAALTGVEAISNGIPAFKKPEPQNAAATLMWMAIILGVLFIAITVLARELGVRHSEEVSAPAQIAQTVFGGDNPIFYLIQAFTALILFLAANTAYADFPRLGSILAKDKFLPHQFLFRGDRLAFTNGIIVLGGSSILLLIVFNADVNRLIPLYAFGVFLSFTLSQSGMLLHWWRNREIGWQRSMVINSVGAVTTGIVAVIVGGTKFVEGAWIAMIMIALLAVLLWAIYQHYTGVEHRLQMKVRPTGTLQRHRQAIVVPIDQINLATIRTVEYARTLSPNVRALHVTDDLEAGQRFQREWESTVFDVPLYVIRSPFRAFVEPVVRYVDDLDQIDPGQYVTVVLPEYRTKWPWQRWLHNQSARRLKTALEQRPNTVLIEVPYHLGISGIEQDSGA